MEVSDGLQYLVYISSMKDLVERQESIYKYNIYEKLMHYNNNCIINNSGMHLLIQIRVLCDVYDTLSIHRQCHIMDIL